MMRIFIVGAGGFGREVLRYLQDTIAAARLEAEIAGFLDDTLPKSGSIVGDTGAIRPAEEDRFVIAVGAPDSRAILAERLARSGCRLLGLVHPTAYVPPEAVLEDGAIVCPLAFVGIGARLGRNTGERSN